MISNWRHLKFWVLYVNLVRIPQNTDCEELFKNSIVNYYLKSLLAFTAKCGVPTNQWTWLCQALLEVSMTTIALWICVCADDWAAESAVKASNDEL